MNPQNHFCLTSSHESFNDKQKNLFSELDKVNVVLSQQIVNEPDDESKANRNVRQSSLKSFRGKESIFKRPEVPIRKKLPLRRLPEFQKNPHKWTKYTLDDVKDEDISENGNRKAALTFLKELEGRNSVTEVISGSTVPNKIVFQKSALVCDMTNTDESKQAFKHSKVIMPEYIVGQKIKKERRNKERRSGIGSKQLSLSHLTEEDDET